MQQSRGISLLGFMVFLVFVGVLAYVFVPRFLAPSREESVAKLKTDFTSFYEALNKYRLDNGEFPSTEQGLQALVVQPDTNPVPQFWKNGGYLRVIPLDPWDQPYQYVNNYGVIRIFSYGTNGKGGGTEIDIANVDE